MSKKRIIGFSVGIVIIIITIIAGFSNNTNNKDLETSVLGANDKDEIYIHYIDVGQGDCIFIDAQDIDILIDGGNNSDGELVVDYLNELDTDDIELMIATHPHEDHIGGLDNVIYAFDVEKILKPAFANNTKTNADFEIAIDAKSISYEWPNQGEVYTFGDITITILSFNNKQYDSTNDYSIVCRLDYFDSSFIFTGDAEIDVEHDIIDSGIDISADVFKVAHHGSESSTTANFLYKIDPSYAVISVGEDNSYGHPHDIPLKRLELQDVPYIRTDIYGTIIFETNGKDISYTSKKTNTDSKKSGNVYSENDNQTIAMDINKKDEIVTLINLSNSDIDISGYTVESVKDALSGQSYVLAENTILKANSTLTLASGDAVGDIKLTNNNIWNNSSSDPGVLYDKDKNIIATFKD